MRILTDQQAEYVRQRIAGKTQKDAYAIAYPKSRFWKPTTRAECGCRLEAKPHVKAVLEAARRQKLAQAVEDGIIDGVDVMRELACIGFSDAADYVQVDVDEEGRASISLTDTSKLTRAQRAAIAGIKYTANGIEIKLHGKLGALKLLGDAAGLFGQAEGVGKDVEDLKTLAELLNDGDEDGDD